MKYEFNGTEKNYTYYSGDNNSSQSLSLDTLTSSFVITELYLKVRDDWGDTYKYFTGGGKLWYKTGGDAYSSCSTNTSSSKGDQYSYDDQNLRNYELQNTNCNTTVASYTDNSGIYTFTHYFCATGVNNNTNYDTYVSNNQNNYKFTYTILPPAISGFGVTGSGTDIIGGTGTPEDPYIIKNGGSLTLTVGGNKAHTDANSTLLIKLGDREASSDNDTTITSITSTEKASFVVKSYCYNDDDDLTGEESEETIYYKAARKYDLSIISTYGWASLYLDYAVTIPSGVDVYAASSMSTTEVTLSSVSAGTILPANTGIIVNGSSCTFHESVSTPASISSIFSGVTSNTSVAASTVYVLSDLSTPDNCVFSTYTGTTLNANRVYIPIPYGGAPSIRFIIEGEETTTDIKGIKESENAVKFFENGQIYIMRNGVVYDATGRAIK